MTAKYYKEKTLRSSYFFAQVKSIPENNLSRVSFFCVRSFFCRLSGRDGGRVKLFSYSTLMRVNYVSRNLV